VLFGCANVWIRPAANPAAEAAFKMLDPEGRDALFCFRGCGFSLEPTRGSADTAGGIRKKFFESVFSRAGKISLPMLVI